jgi:hypothetical protein
MRGCGNLIQRAVSGGGSCLPSLRPTRTRSDTHSLQETKFRTSPLLSSKQDVGEDAYQLQCRDPEQGSEVRGYYCGYTALKQRMRSVRLDRFPLAENRGRQRAWWTEIGRGFTQTATAFPIKSCMFGQRVGGGGCGRLGSRKDAVRQGIIAECTREWRVRRADWLLQAPCVNSQRQQSVLCELLPGVIWQKLRRLQRSSNFNFRRASAASSLY